MRSRPTVRTAAAALAATSAALLALLLAGPANAAPPPRFKAVALVADRQGKAPLVRAGAPGAGVARPAGALHDGAGIGLNDWRLSAGRCARLEGKYDDDRERNAEEPDEQASAALPAVHAQVPTMSGLRRSASVSSV